MNCGQLSQYVAREKRHLLGGLETASPEEAEEALAFATEALNSKSNGFYELSVHEVKEVQKQVDWEFLFCCCCCFNGYHHHHHLMKTLWRSSMNMKVALHWQSHWLVIITLVMPNH